MEFYNLTDQELPFVSLRSTHREIPIHVALGVINVLRLDDDQFCKEVTQFSNN